MLSEGATVIDFTGPWEVFQDADVPVPFELYTVAPSRNPIRTSGNGSHGISITPDYTFADAPEPDLIVIGAQSGGAGLSAWLQKLHGDNKIILSVCTGAFKVAQAGSTHWPARDHSPRVCRQTRCRIPQGAGQTIRPLRSIRTHDLYRRGIDLRHRSGAAHGEGYFGHGVAQKTADYMEYQGTGWKGPRPKTPRFVW